MKTLILILIFSSSLICAPSSIAYVSKTKGDVKHKKKSDENYEEPKKGTQLYNNDLIQTGDNGFAKYIYIDDGTQIKIHNNSEVYIRGELERRSIIKQLKVDEGTIKFDIKKQSSDEFTVITPTSVASVKGTSFWIDCNGKSGDQFFGESGSVVIRNRESGEKRELTKNKVASSMPDGTLDVRQITVSELEMLQNIEEETGEAQNTDSGTGNSQSQDSTGDEIIIQFQDDSGDQKTITIRVK